MERHDTPEEQGDAVTVQELGMWIPIILTTVGLLVVVLGGMVTNAVSTASRLTAIEVESKYLLEQNRKLEERVDKLTIDLYRIQVKNGQRTVSDESGNGISTQTK